MRVVGCDTAAIQSLTYVGDGHDKAALGRKGRPDRPFVDGPQVELAAVRAGQEQRAVRREGQLPRAGCGHRRSGSRGRQAALSALSDAVVVRTMPSSYQVPDPADAPGRPSPGPTH